MSNQNPPEGAPSAPPAPTTDDRVPLERLQAATRARDEALTQVADLSTRLESLQAQIGELTTARDTEATRAAGLVDDLALATHGLTDPQGRIVARALHGALGEDAPSIAEWVRGLADAPDTAPLGLRAYLSAPAAPTDSPPQGRAGAAGLPRSAPATPAPPPAGSPVQALQAANQALQSAMKSGDGEAVTAARRNLERALSGLR